MEQRTYYQKIEQIGKGGHGTVDKVKNQDGNLFARKTLTHVRQNGAAYKRFKSEIDVLLLLKNQAGIVPILDHYFPDNFSKNDRPYYIMPLGIMLATYLQGKSQEILFKRFLELCEAVERLHSRDITHRDIKPSNLLVINEKPVLADFGLANFPEKEKVSVLDEVIGAKWTIAPEMERVSSSAAYKKADIYSLAKTLWILITRSPKGFEGQYIQQSPISLDKYIDLHINKGSIAGEWYYFSIVLLERLLINSTSNDPDQRPSITDFIHQLKYWYTSNMEYKERNPYEWEDALQRIFPFGIPDHCEWKGISNIFSILRILTQYDNLNHCFLPPHGGVDMKEIELTEEDECLKMEHYIFKPKILYFDMIEDLSWSYFKLEFSILDPIIHNDYDNVIREHLYKNYEGELSNEEDGYLFQTRYLKGSIVITAKRSAINRAKGPLDGYSGIHYKMTAAEYRKAWELYKAKDLSELENLIGNRNNTTV
jgi:serine/threonine protein kinase